jgi:hypothetical protein
MKDILLQACEVKLKLSVSLIRHHAIKVYEEVPPFLISALDGRGRA